MKLKLIKLLNAQEGLQALANTKGLSSVVAYRIAKNVKALDEELNTYEETRKKLVEEKANKDEEGKPIIKDDKYDLTNKALKEVNKELNALLEEEVDIDIKELSLIDIDKAGLSALELSSIDFMIREEE